MPRKEKKFHFIYKTTNIKTGRYYYGMHSTNKLDDGYLGSGKRLRYSINKYGKDNHQREILEFLDSREDLKTREKEIVNLNEIAKDDCMNLIIGGEGGWDNNLDAQSKRGLKGNAKMKHLFENDPVWVKKRSNNLSKGIKLAYKEGRKEIKTPDWTGRSHSEESNNKGSNNSQYGTCWIHNKELKKSKKIHRGDIIPIGWKLGRKLKF